MGLKVSYFSSSVMKKTKQYFSEAQTVEKGFDYQGIHELIKKHN